VHDKRHRWLVVAIMAIATISFAGFSLFLPLSGVFRDNSRTAASPTASPSGNPEELEAQARGYELVLQREPDNQTALRGLVEVRLEQRNIEATIAPLEKLAALNPDQTDYIVLLAQVKQRSGDREGAAQAYRQILKSRPGDINALQGLVDLLLEENRPAVAISTLQDTLKLSDEANKVQPGSVDVVSVQLLLARVYAEEARYAEAIALYDKASQAASQDFRPLFGKAMVLQAQGKNDEAKPLFTKASELAPPQFKDQINQMAAGEPPAAAPGEAPAAPVTGESPAVAPSPAQE
jgi:tetratricopeptide (TPR) repeat protein